VLVSLMFSLSAAAVQEITIPQQLATTAAAAALADT